MLLMAILSSVSTFLSMYSEALHFPVPVLVKVSV